MRPRSRRITTELRVRRRGGAGSAGLEVPARRRRTGCRTAEATTTSPAGSSAGGSVSIRVPSGLTSHRLTVIWFDWRAACRITDKPTPTSTAYCSGMMMVSAKVVTRTAFCTAPVFHTDCQIGGSDGPEAD